MMEDNRRSSGALFGGLGRMGGGDHTIGSAGSMGSLSPYLNMDPSYLQTQAPEFIFNQDHKRGRMENSFTAIGSSVLIGGALGGTYGMLDGIRQTAELDMKGSLRRTQILNHTLKSGGSISNALGSIAVIYSSIYCLLSLGREEDDEAKSCVTGAATGLLYKSSSGLKRCARGGAVGLALSAAWAFLIKRDKRISDYV